MIIGMNVQRGKTAIRRGPPSVPRPRWRKIFRCGHFGARSCPRRRGQATASLSRPDCPTARRPCAVRRARPLSLRPVRHAAAPREAPPRRGLCPASRVRWRHGACRPRPRRTARTAAAAFAPHGRALSGSSARPRPGRTADLAARQAGQGLRSRCARSPAP